MCDLWWSSRVGYEVIGESDPVCVSWEKGVCNGY